MTMNKKELTEKGMVCPHCASDDVFSKDERDVDKYWCGRGCGAIDEVITGQEFCDREAWDTERRAKAADDAGCFDFWPRSQFI